MSDQESSVIELPPGTKDEPAASEPALEQRPPDSTATANGHDGAPQPEQIVVTIVAKRLNGIIVDITVNGPIHIKGLCYEMLELARDTIKDFTDQKARQAATMGIQPGAMFGSLPPPLSRKQQKRILRGR